MRVKSKDNVDDPALMNRTALNEVLSPSMPQLHHAAARVLRNWHDSEDALQEGLLSAWCHVDQFEGRSCMSTWLHTIVTNAARMQLRKRSRSQTTPIADDFPVEDGVCAAEIIADSRPNPEEECARRERSRLLQQRVRRLPPAIGPWCSCAYWRGCCDGKPPSSWEFRRQR